MSGDPRAPGSKCICCEECSDDCCNEDGLGPCLNRCRCAELEAQRDDDWDPSGCPGCGGNCQTACA